MVRAICALHEADELLFNFLLLTQHASLRQPLPEDRNRWRVICRWVAEAMASGEIPAGNATIVAGADHWDNRAERDVFVLYGRLPEGLAEHADEIVDLCLRIVS